MTVGPLGAEKAAEPSPIADVNAVRQLGFAAAIGTLGYVFWIVGAMEMVERLAYYGVKAVATLYAKAPASSGGLGITMTRFGTVLMVWALVQTFVPALTGGLSDRYGYKETIFASTLVKISGYLTMATWPTFGGFLAGAVLLATGTGIFKPGIQATLVKATGPNNSSMAWGIFYQTVNIGGYIGPLVAGLMRKMAWRYVFLANAAVICLNFLLLLAYKEPGKEQRLANDALRKRGHVKREALAIQSLRELRKLHVWTYLLIFSGFWFMFNALFDVLPAHIDDWVDSTGIVKTLFSSHWAHSPIVQFFVVLNKDGTAIQPEGMLNLNAGMIMITCFAFAYVSGKMRATTSMVVGTLLATLAFCLCGYSNTGWLTLGSIAVFSVGEMLSSPKFNEFIGNFAPLDKKAMYLGFSQIPLAIGWTLEGKVGPMLYDAFASKERFARTALRERGLLGAADLARVPEGEAFSKLVALTGETKEAVTHTLYVAHNVGAVWYVMAVVGILSAAGIYAYGRWIVGRANAPLPAITR
jgi:proton-dependent oligopeptide transporter, POT family